MPRKRNIENRSLPRRWRFIHNAFYYRVPTGEEALWDGKKQFRLGRNLAEAHKTFSERIAPFENVKTMAQLCDRYCAEIIPDKAPATQKSNLYSIQRIRRVFLNNPVMAIQPHHIYEYKNRTGQTESKKKANLDLEVLSHMFTKAIEWGARNDHPMTNKKVVKFSLQPRKRYVTDEELMSFASTLPLKWRLYVSLKVWTGRRKGELLRVRLSDLTEEGIRFHNNKQPYDRFIVEWTPETRRIVQSISNLKRPIASMYLFATRDGQPYIKPDGSTSGFDSIWQRYMRGALRDGIIAERFTEHDLRAKRASEMSLEDAQILLRHTNPDTTRRHYRALEEVIRAR
jgi:integrase